MDSDILDELKTKLFGQMENKDYKESNKINTITSIISNIEPLTGNEDDVVSGLINLIELHLQMDGQKTRKVESYQFGLKNEH